MTISPLYSDGTYVQHNPDWHVAASPWKAKAIVNMLERNGLHPQSLCDIGCGAGETLRLLQEQLGEECHLQGYDIAAHAIALAKSRENERLHFSQGDFRTLDTTHYDLILMIDVLQHLEHCWDYLRDIKARSPYKLIQVPLDIAAMPVIRNELIEFHTKTGHLHFFTKDIAFALLQRCGYDIVDWCYTMPPIDTSPWSEVGMHPRKLGRKLLRVTKRGLQRLPGDVCALFNEDLSARLFGGRRLLLLVR